MRKIPKVLVLGGNGFIGSHLVDGLVNQGIHTRVFGRTHLGGTSNLQKSPLLELVEGDFIHEGDLRGAIEGCDICYHLISTTLPKSSNDDPGFDVRTNIAGTLRLLDYAVENRLKKIIFLSSGGTVYGPPKESPINESHPTDPICSYGITKLAIEKYLELYRVLHGLNYTILRLSNPYGERQRILATQGAVAVFLNKAINNEPIEIWGDGSVVRDYIHISDVISALLVAKNYEGDQRVFNIGAGEGRSLNDLIETIEQVIGHTVARNYKPARTFDVPVSVLSIAKARQLLGWSPSTSFEEGISRTADWIRLHR